ncbi:MAG: dethiobiotin synthase [Candidatus Gastranaerophilales bacterium]|nr:dethiobiotin synthase [Candidatus Gastranaerophilales bacterium]
MYIFVTGTDTDVGKSYVAKGICEQLRNDGETAAYLKPFQSGVAENVLSDAQMVGGNAKSSYVTKTPSNPLISAEIDGVELDLEKVAVDFSKLKKECDNVIVEGSGGIYVPVKKGVLMADLIKRLNLPALIVARPDLGTINHTLMTIECLLNNNIKVLGVVISNYPAKTNDPVILRAKEMIELYSGHVKVLDIIKHDQKDFSLLVSKIIEQFAMSV